MSTGPAVRSRADSLPTTSPGIAVQPASSRFINDSAVSTYNYRLVARLLMLLVVCGTGGYGRFTARRISQALNTYPSWLVPRRT